MTGLHDTELEKHQCLEAQRIAPGMLPAINIYREAGCARLEPGRDNYLFLFLNSLFIHGHCTLPMPLKTNLQFQKYLLVQILNNWLTEHT